MFSLYNFYMKLSVTATINIPNATRVNRGTDTMQPPTWIINTQLGGRATTVLMKC